jgi:xanthine dehydrogenase YagT iron-sulfur-binding subunit
VLVNGERINACLSLAAMHDGDSVTTIEGIGGVENLHVMQQAFLANDAFQCGYCTPGQICSAVGMLQEAASGWPSQATEDLEGLIALTDAEIRERMSGNICRCSAYTQILAAIRDVAGVVA